MKDMKKKGMGLPDMYPAVLTLVLVFMLVGIGVLILDQFGQAALTGLAVNETSIANSTFNAGRDAIGTFNTDWAAIIVLIVAAAVIIGLIVAAFMFYKTRR